MPLGSWCRTKKPVSVSTTPPPRKRRLRRCSITEHAEHYDSLRAKHAEHFPNRPINSQGLHQEHLNAFLQSSAPGTPSKRPKTNLATPLSPQTGLQGDVIHSLSCRLLKRRPLKTRPLRLLLLLLPTQRYRGILHPRAWLLSITWCLGCR